MVKHINPPSNPKRILSIAVGVIFIAGGLFLLGEFMLKFLKIVVGLVFLMVGIQFLFRR
jgi:uncharacterized membrane protein HdeD (DUF308 family)